MPDGMWCCRDRSTRTTILPDADPSVAGCIGSDVGLSGAVRLVERSHVADARYSF